MSSSPLDVATVRLNSYDVLAPDGCEIRVLSRVAGASMAHGTLPAGRISQAIRHRTVEEIWYALSGAAEIWRRLGGEESLDLVSGGQSLALPAGCEFQVRTVGAEPFTFIMCTLPPWPGEDEAVPVAGKWEVVDDAV
jgi:mannose-6-phosphate isomerase-like protein (cupin superfamily)